MVIDIALVFKDYVPHFFYAGAFGFFLKSTLAENEPLSESSMG
jgi:hypothetical protein